jgi:CheY-like chemotaxis protein
MRYTLSSYGYRVVEAANMQEAATFCSAREISIDLAILHAAAESDSKWPTSHPCAPVLTILSDAQGQNPSDDFWQLSFDPEELLSQVRSALADRGVGQDSGIDYKGEWVEGHGEIDISTTRVEAGGMRAVLIVEDNQLLRQAVATMLRRHGFTAFEAEDGTSAIALFKARQAEIGLVLLDMTLPGISGGEVFETLEQIRPGVKVILTTAHGHEMINRAIGGRQPWVFVRKPYRVTDLVELIRTAQTHN